MEGVAEGGYALSAVTPFLDSLGVSHRGKEILVRGEESTEVQLELPPREETLEALCGASPGEPRLAVLIGSVWTMGTGEPVAGATVTVEWEEKEYPMRRGPLQQIKVTTDDAGRYRACVIPAGTPINVWATGRNAKSALERLEPPPGDLVSLDLWMVGLPLPGLVPGVPGLPDPP